MSAWHKQLFSSHLLLYFLDKHEVFAYFKKTYMYMKSFGMFHPG